jgi:hypothetical protein
MYKHKSGQFSPVFEKMNQERMRRSRENTESAKRTLEEAQKLIDQSEELLRRVRSRKRKAS